MLFGIDFFFVIFGGVGRLRFVVLSLWCFGRGGWYGCWCGLWGWGWCLVVCVFGFRIFKRCFKEDEKWVNVCKIG